MDASDSPAVRPLPDGRRRRQTVARIAWFVRPRPSTAPNRKSASPDVRKMSPSEATLRMNGSGIGMTSPRKPSRVMNVLSSWAGRITWNAAPMSAGVNPAAASADAQTVMWPPLMRTTSVLLAMPVKASVMPG